NTLAGSPGSVGMDEDYDACDLENWFLAIQSADGQVVIPSFHRPGIIRYDLNPASGNPVVNDWQRINTDNPNNGGSLYATPPTPPQCRPTATPPNPSPPPPPHPPPAKPPYASQTAGRAPPARFGAPPGPPPRRDANGTVYKPLFAFMVIGLNGRIPLNTAGNL